MRFKPKKISFAAVVTANGKSTPTPYPAGGDNVTNNNLSAPYPDQGREESYGPESLEIPEKPSKIRRFFKTYGTTPIWFAALMCITAILIPCVLLITMYGSPSVKFPYGDCVLLEEYRTTCITAYSKKVSQQQCEGVNCCWDAGTKECYHSIPSRHGYLWSSSNGSAMMSSDADFELSARLPRTPLLTKSYPQLRALVRFASRRHLRIVIGTPGSSLLADAPASDVNDSDLEVSVANSAFTFEVYRKGDDAGGALVSSSRSPLIASDKYWEIGLRCPPQGAVYGLGGLEPGNTTLLYSSSSRSGSFPYLLCLGPSGKAHGVMIRNSGPMEVSFMKKSNIVILRALSNLGWDVSVFSGPRPGDVLDQLTGIVGRPRLPPYWVLGFHVCRDFSSEGMNVTGVNATAIMEEFFTFQKYSASQGLPYDSDCLHERLLNQLNATASAEVINAVAAAFDSLQANGKKFLLSLPPQVVDGEDSLLLRQADGSRRYDGEYRGRQVSYPDFTHPNASRWMASRLQALLPSSSAGGNVSRVLAGFALVDNWPEDVSPHDAEELPYLPEAARGSLSDDTVYWSAQRWDKKPHYEIHNVYGRQQSDCLRDAAELQNPVIVTSSCGLGSAACLNQQQVSPNASWASLKQAVVSVLGNGLAGVPLAGGGPLCGAEGDVASEELCLSWYLVGAVLPVMRVSSAYPLRDPAHASSAYMSGSVLAALKQRYSLLPYYYTLLSEASSTGEPIVRPMFYEFPHDAATWGLDEQFMVGPALLAAPGLRAGLPVVSVYLPQGNSTWYLLDGGLALNHGSGGLNVSVANTGGRLVLLLRGGHVLPTQEPGADSHASRLGSYKLTVALDCDSDGCSADGHVTLEENVTVTFRATSTSVAVGNLHEACSRVSLPPLAEVTVLRPAIDQSTTYRTTQNTQSSSLSPNATETSISSVSASAASTAPQTTIGILPTTVSSTTETSGAASSIPSSSTGEVTTQTASTAETSGAASSIPSSSTGEITTQTASTANTSGATSSSPISSKATDYSSVLPAVKTGQQQRGRKKRQISSPVRAANINSVQLLDAPAPVTHKLNSTSLCSGEDSITFNFV